VLGRRRRRGLGVRVRRGQERWRIRKKTGCRRRNVIKEDLVAEEQKTSVETARMG